MTFYAPRRHATSWCMSIIPDTTAFMHEKPCLVKHTTRIADTLLPAKHVHHVRYGLLHGRQVTENQTIYWNTTHPQSHGTFGGFTICATSTAPPTLAPTTVSPTIAPTAAPTLPECPALANDAFFRVAASYVGPPVFACGGMFVHGIQFFAHSSVDDLLSVRMRCLVLCVPI